ncbi:MAG: hypothetical protein EGP90_00035 [Bacteroides sp.]|nr:hypothetical protein [Bacteroides sp.]
MFLIAYLKVVYWECMLQFILLMLHVDTFMNVNEIYNIVSQDIRWYICSSLYDIQLKRIIL